MLKRLTVAVAALFVLATSAFGAGTVPGFSLAQQQDSDGTPLVGCLLYTIQAGTVSTPQSGYQDSALTIPLSNPIICDAYGRLPQIFLADGSIKLRLTKSNGVQVFAADGILVVGASSGGGGGSPVDATTILATGDMKARYGTGVLSGFVRANGRNAFSQCGRAPIEAPQDVQHAQEGRAQQIAALREHGIEVRAAPLEAGVRHLHRERHLRLRQLDVELGEQPQQLRISPFVEDEEAGVDAVPNTVERDVDRVRVTAAARRRFIQRDSRVP